MAHLLNGEALTVAYGTRTVLAGVGLGVDDGARVGVVGRNGDGKSTLLEVLAGARLPDSGRVTHSRGVRVGLLAQADGLDPATDVRHCVIGDLPDHAWAANPAIREVFTGLLGGLDAAAVGGMRTPIGELSGGQRRRVALAALLAGDSDVLLLDEPTNHLDVDGIGWLAAHLRDRWPAGKGGIIVVTHDRWFLDAICTSMWEVHDGMVDSYEGGYAAYVLARAERARIAAADEERRQNLLRKELAWLRRGPPARSSKPRFRIDAANALIADEPPPRDSLVLRSLASTRLGKDVLDLEDVSVRVGTELGPRTLLDQVTWRIGPGDRIGIVGANGSGKTTVLRLLLGDLAADSGRVRRGKTVRPAVLSQDLVELDEVNDLRVHQAVERVRGSVRLGDREVTAGQLLEQLGFTRERIWTLVGDLSGGERRRLQLLRLLMAEPNVLLLDEPTNDLDTDTLAAVEDALDGWAGTLIVVSHDRYLVERLTDRQVGLLGDGRIRDLPGGIEEYLRLRAENESRAASASRAVPGGGEPTGDRGESGPGAPERPSAARIRSARKELARLERRLARFGEQEEQLHAEMVDHATDHEKVLELDTRLRELAEDRDRVEQEWFAIAEIVD